MKSIKKTAFICVLSMLGMHLHAQGWVGSGSNLYGVNNVLGLTPLNVGIGTNSPTAQFHTTGSVRFAGLLSSSNNRIIVIDSPGNLTYLPPGTPGSVLTVNGSGSLQWSSSTPTNAWLLTGNTVTSSDFIGTLNAQAFRVRTNNNEHFFMRGASITLPGSFRVLPEGSFSFNEVAASATQLTYGQVVMDNPESFIRDSTNNYGLDDGLIIFNENNTAGVTERSSSLCFGARDEANGFHATASISGVVVAPDQMDIFFKNEYAGPQRQRLTMRIGHDGRVGVGTNAVNNPPTAKFHVDGTVRFENLPSGTGNMLVVDASGNVYRSACKCSPTGLDDDGGSRVAELEDEVARLNNELNAIKEQLASLGSPVRVPAGTYDVSVFPNPNDGSFQVKFLNNQAVPSDSIVNILVMDATGRSVYNTFMEVKEGENIQQISGMNVAAGMYTLTFVAGGRVLTSETIVIK